MSDLISRKALIEEYNRVHIGPPGGARKLMEDTSTVDAVEVVRCKNCKHWWKENKLCCNDKCCNGNVAVMDAPPNHFCSYGERRSDD